jgi:hypothetical protein
MAYPKVPTPEGQKYYLAWGCLAGFIGFGLIAVIAASTGNKDATNAAMTLASSLGTLTGVGVAWYFKDKLGR